jgi:hypothetical protein
VRAQSQSRAELLTPVVKGWCTEQAQLVTWTGVQIHGGMGFVEETGAAQYMRDARITTIYEGTTGIQANDLVGRKLCREGGSTMAALQTAMREDAAHLVAEGQTSGTDGLGRALLQGLDALQTATAHLLATYASQPAAVNAGAVPFLKLTGHVVGGWLMARQAQSAAAQLGAGSAEEEFLQAKLVTARHYMAHVMSECAGLQAIVTEGAASTLGLADSQF